MKKLFLFLPFLEVIFRNYDITQDIIFVVCLGIFWQKVWNPAVWFGFVYILKQKLSKIIKSIKHKKKFPGREKGLDTQHMKNKVTHFI